MKLSLRIPERLRPWLILPPLAVGFAVLVLFVNSRRGPERLPQVERRTPVAVIAVAPLDVVPRALGYGTVEPGRIWRAVAQVSGRVVECSPLLEAGAVATADAVLVRIDPREYELAVSELEASVLGLDAQIAELATREANAVATVEIERRSLAVSEKELTRTKELLAGGTGSQANVDREERAYLTQRARVRELENTLSLVPAERKTLLANRAATQARLDSARLTLSHTTVSAPFDCRIVSRDVEETQFVTAGQVMAEAHGAETAEVNAQVPLGRMRALIPVGSRKHALTELVSQELLAEFGLGARIRLRVAGLDIRWDARVERISGVIDAKTRTLGVIVVVDKPYEKMIPGVRPPLMQGMYCEVEVRGKAKSGRILVPRVALHGDEVYLVEDERLVRRAVQVDFPLGDFVCLAGGLAGGETLIVSDPIPAIDGMLVDTQDDQALQQRLLDVASGKAALR